MPPQTRARRRPPADPPGTVYHAQRPLRQRRFPIRQTTTKRPPPVPALKKRQSTLTQIEFVELDVVADSEEEGSQEDEDEEEVVKERAGKKRKGRDGGREVEEKEDSGKRRRSGGRRVSSRLGSVGESQKTLTQMPWAIMGWVGSSQGSEEETEDDGGDGLGWESGGNEEKQRDTEVKREGGSVERDVPDRSVPTTGNGRRTHDDRVDRGNAISSPQSRPTSAGGPPTTPRRHRVFEIPSSQSPPQSALSTQKSTRYRSPLRERMANRAILETPSKLRHVTFNGSPSKPSPSGGARVHRRVQATPHSVKLLRRTSTHVLDSDAEEETESEFEEDQRSKDPIEDVQGEELEIRSKTDFGAVPLSRARSSPAPALKSQDSGPSTVRTLDLDLHAAVVREPSRSKLQGTTQEESAAQSRCEVDTSTQRPTTQMIPSSPIDLTDAFNDFPPFIDEEEGIADLPITANSSTLATMNKDHHDGTVRTSQASTVAEPTQQLHQRGQRQQRSSPPALRRPTRSQPGEVSSPMHPPPVVLIPSSPIPLPPMSSSPTSRSRLETQNGVPTISQLLPESLADYSIPPPPAEWTQDDDEL